LVSAGAALAFVAAHPDRAVAAQTYDITTLAGKIASLRGTAGLQIRFSAFIEQEAEEEEGTPSPTAITPVHVLSSPLDGTTIVALTFTDVSTAAGFFGLNSSWCAAWGDYDNDGNLDVMTLGHNQANT